MGREKRRNVEVAIGLAQIAIIRLEKKALEEPRTYVLAEEIKHAKTCINRIAHYIEQEKQPPKKRTLWSILGMVMALVMLSGCAASPASHEPTYTVLIDRSFTAEHQADILNELDTWSASTRAVFSPVVVDSNALFDDPRNVRNTIAIHNRGTGVAKEEGVCVVSLAWNSASIDFDEATGAFFFVIGLHELGHAMGLSHQMDPNVASVMQPYVQNASSTITAEDVEQFQKVWQ